MCEELSYVKGLFHIHSKYSFDSFLRPEDIVDYAVDREFHILAITDHDTIAGSLAAHKYNKCSRLHVVIGAEYATDKGDIIGLLLNSEIKSSISEQVVHQIIAQGGIAVLPHPFKGHKLDEQLVKSVDLIEVYNGRVSSIANQTATELAQKYHKQTIAGSDAHFFGEFDSVYVAFEAQSDGQCLRSLLLEASREFRCKDNNKHKYYEVASQLVKSYKLRDVRLFASVAKWLALNVIAQ